MAEDIDIQHRIKGLIDEEHGLRARLAEGEISVEEENQRLRSIEVELDQCWDLLRQRRARREFGEDPDDAQVRDAAVVENYRGGARGARRASGEPAGPALPWRCSKTP